MLRTLLNAFRENTVVQTAMPLSFYNTLGREKRLFTLPPHAKHVRMYNCGPTVYARQHIGNLSAAVFADTIRRVLEYDGYAVKQVINITDFGHLASDADEGDDKMAKGLKREGEAFTMQNMLALATKYRDLYLEDIERLNVETRKIQFPRASEHVPAQIAMIETLMQKGYAYETRDSVYFEASKFPEYGKLGGVNLEGQKEGARIEAKTEKRGPHDFALWKKNPKLGWDSPWGKGFPGWHIECSAMIHSLLGPQIDIHTGGIEHIPVHHNNEIAQSEAATGKKPFVRYWLHRAHIRIEGAKIAKSEGNVIDLSEVIERGFHPLALRYLFLGAHYRTPANFSWEAIAAAQKALARLLALRLSIEQPGAISPVWKDRFTERVNDDLDTPGALAIVWEMTKDAALSGADLLATILDFDRVLGLELAEPDEAARSLASQESPEEIAIETLPSDIRALVDEREAARKELHFDRADELRRRITGLGYYLHDVPGAVRVFRK